MGNKQPSVQNNCIQELSNINENDLDISNIDKLQIKAIKEMSERLKALEERKSDRILYRLPVQLCNYSIFWVNDIK